MALNTFWFLMVPVLTVLLLVFGRYFSIPGLRKLRRCHVRRLVKGSLILGLTGAALVISSGSVAIASAGGLIAVVGVWLGSILVPIPREE